MGIVPIPVLLNVFWMSCARPLSVETSRMSHRVEISVESWRRRALTCFSGSPLCPSLEISAVLVFEPNPVFFSTSPLKRLKKRAKPAEGMTGTCGAYGMDGTTRCTVCCGFGAGLNSCCLYPACTSPASSFGSPPALQSGSGCQRDHVLMSLLILGLLQLGVAPVSRWLNNLMESSTDDVKNVGSFGWGAPSCICSGCSYPPTLGFSPPYGVGHHSLINRVCFTPSG